MKKNNFGQSLSFNSASCRVLFLIRRPRSENRIFILKRSTPAFSIQRIDLIEEIIARLIAYQTNR